MGNYGSRSGPSRRTECHVTGFEPVLMARSVVEQRTGGAAHVLPDICSDPGRFQRLHAGQNNIPAALVPNTQRLRFDTHQIRHSVRTENSFVFLAGARFHTFQDLPMDIGKRKNRSTS
jgi:hypothetical protein